MPVSVDVFLSCLVILVGIESCWFVEYYSRYSVDWQYRATGKRYDVQSYRMGYIAGGVAFIAIGFYNAVYGWGFAPHVNSMLLPGILLLNGARKFFTSSANAKKAVLWQTPILGGTRSPEGYVGLFRAIALLYVVVGGLGLIGGWWTVG